MNKFQLSMCLIVTVFSFGAYSAKLIVAKSGGAYASIQAGVTAAQAGDTVLVNAGTYNESVTFGKSGSQAAGYITLLAQPGAILDGTGRGEQGITIRNTNYIKVIGMEIRNFTGSGTPIGISIEGSSSFLEIRNNVVHHIENANGNAHGIAFYGTAATPISSSIVDGNEIRNCRLGQSESMVFNGNVTDFTVSGNSVHDNDNIGIDFIGFEGTGPTGQDQARGGSCIGNHVYGISSAANPTYGGERSADGIYVDGGRDIIIERNTIDTCDIGIEVASEHGGKTTSNITVRGNFVSRSYQGNIMVGGYDSDRGSASNITIVNNTLFHGRDGEVILQFNCSGISIRNNICAANSATDYLSASGSNYTAVTVDNNLYFGASANDPGAWNDAHAKFGDPMLVNAPVDMHIRSASPARNGGAPYDTAIMGILDIDGQPRMIDGIIDIGADEIGSVAIALRYESPFNRNQGRIVMRKTQKATLPRGFLPCKSRATRVFSIDGKFLSIQSRYAAAVVINQTDSPQNDRSPPR
jgi:hypothetical protein